LSGKFNFNQLLNIVKKHINESNFLTPTQQLEKQRMDLEKQKLEYDLISKIIDNNKYSKLI
jgi:hypothetical protein